MARPYLFVACCLVIGALAGGCSDSGTGEGGVGAAHAQGVENTTSHGLSSARPARVVEVAVETVAPTPLKDMLVLPGQTEARHDVQLAMDAEGTVEWVGVERGDLVEQGQEIFRLDAAMAAAQLAKAKADIALKQDLASRRQALYEQQVLSKEELDQALTELAVAKATLAEAKTHLSHSVLLAPFAGRINNLAVDPGEYVHKGDPVIELVNVATIRVTVHVPEMDVRYLKVGDRVLISIDAYGEERWEGVVDFVAYKADPATKTFDVRVEVDNADGRIRPGMAARVAFLRRDIPDAITAPLFAVVDKGGERLVFVVENGKARSRQIAIGHIAADRVQILQGLAPGDALIISGHKDVEDGMAVTVRPQADTPGTASSGQAPFSGRASSPEDSQALGIPPPSGGASAFTSTQDASQSAGQGAAQ